MNFDVICSSNLNCASTTDVAIVMLDLPMSTNAVIVLKIKIAAALLLANFAPEMFLFEMFAQSFAIVKTNVAEST